MGGGPDHGRENASRPKDTVLAGLAPTLRRTVALWRSICGRHGRRPGDGDAWPASPHRPQGPTSRIDSADRGRRFARDGDGWHPPRFPGRGATHSDRGHSLGSDQRPIYSTRLGKDRYRVAQIPAGGTGRLGRKNPPLCETGPAGVVPADGVGRGNARRLAVPSHRYPAQPGLTGDSGRPGPPGSGRVSLAAPARSRVRHHCRGTERERDRPAGMAGRSGDYEHPHRNGRRPVSIDRSQCWASTRSTT